MGPESVAADQELPWERASRRPPARVPHLVLSWSLDEPHRIGEAVPVSRPSSLGRGDADPGDGVPRALPRRMRPGSTSPGGPFVNARIARQHLLIDPAGSSRLRVRSMARTPVRINGRMVDDGTVEAGDVVELHNAAVFVVVDRPAEYPPLRSHPGGEFGFGGPDAFGIVGESEATWALRDALAFAAGTNRHALLHGESGVGKELAARTIHGLSSRSSRPLVARNAATLPEALVDAELFGNARNYPNAGMPERAGLLGEAHDSTLFLDEIGELPESSQVHLLRALDQGGEYQRLGEATSSRSSFRLVGATNRSFEALKDDFLARFTHRILVPGLLDRREDVPLVLAELLRRIATSSPGVVARFFERRNGQVAEPRIAPDFVVRLLRHPFTHHARELDRLLWLAIGSAEGDYIGVTEAVEAELGDSASSFVAAAHIGRDELVKALAEHGRNPTQVARALGLKNRYVLHRLLKKHGIGPGSPEGDT